MDYQAYLKAADAGAPPPVALLYGAEPLLIEDAVGRVTRALFPEGGDLSLAREVVESREVGVETIVQSAMLLPWTGTRRLVVAKSVDELGTKAGDALAAYCKTPNPSTVLMLLAPVALPATHWLNKAIPRALGVPVQAPTGGALVSWLKQRASADGITLTNDAASLLVQLAGEDLTHLCGELEKAALAGGADNKKVGPAEVRAVVGETRARHVFDLTRALVDRDQGTALVLMHALLGSGEEPFALLGMLAREARAAWRAADGLRAGRAEDEIARGLGRPPSAANAMIDRARSLSPEAAARQVRRCWEAERRLKLGGAPRAELSLLIADLCAG